jgi:protoporphyrinogen oxidase
MKYTKMPILFGYPQGGWNQIINKMVTKIKENGKIITDCSVNKLKINSNQNKKTKSDPNYSIEGVISNLGIFLSKNVVLAIPPNYIEPFFQNEKGKNVLDKSTRNFIKNLVWTSGISFNFCLKRWAYRGKGLLYFENPYGYGIFVSNLEPTLTPEKKQLMTAFFPLSPENLKDKEYLEKKVDDCRDLIFYHFPKVKERLDFERVIIHDQVDSVLINTSQYKDLRPEPRVKNIVGCYLTGDYLNAYGSGKELGYNSVWKTYGAIAEDCELKK